MFNVISSKTDTKLVYRLTILTMSWPILIKRPLILSSSTEIIPDDSVSIQQKYCKLWSLGIDRGELLASTIFLPKSI